MATRLTKNSPAEKKVMIFAIITAVLLFLLDVLTKYWVVSCFELHESIVLIPDLLAFTSARNLGAAWSILSGYGWLLLIFSIIVALFLCFKFRKIAEGCTERYFALMLLLSGIAGNSLDRAFRGAVVDFIHVHWKNVWHYPIFNVADMAICCGVIIIVISILLRKELKPDSTSKG